MVLARGNELTLLGRDRRRPGVPHDQEGDQGRGQDAGRAAWTSPLSPWATARAPAIECRAGPGVPAGMCRANPLASSEPRMATPSAVPDWPMVSFRAEPTPACS